MEIRKYIFRSKIVDEPQKGPSGRAVAGVRLLRDKHGNHARDDVSFSRRNCDHGVCASCLVGQVVTCAALKGEVFKCPQCAQPWNSWDTRSRTDEETSAAGGGGKRSKVAPYSVERTTWGALPAEQAVFQPPSVRRFYQQHAQAGAVTPPVGSFALAVTAGGDGGKVTNWHCVLPVAADDAQGKQHACQVLQVLGRHLRSSIVEELAPSFSVRGIDRQVDYRAIVELALTDESMLAKFMRSLICGYDAVPSRPEFRDSEVVRKRLMAAWVCTQRLWAGRPAQARTLLELSCRSWVEG